jgi:anti-sigma B factor antagonist
VGTPHCPTVPPPVRRTTIADAGRRAGLTRGHRSVQSGTAVAGLSRYARAMQINERALGGLTILDLNGRLTIDNGAQLLKDKCESLAFQQRTQVIVNLAAVPYIDSGGLGQLVACYTTLSKAGGRLTLANINKTNHDLLSITKLVAVFETFDSEEAAVQSYSVAVRA